MKEIYLCFDLGGSAIKMALIDKEGVLETYDSIAVPKSLDEMFTLMYDLYQQYTKTYLVKGITFSVPGAVNPVTGVIGSMSAIPYIHGPSWKTMWKDCYGLDISIENDANCAALGELYFGKGKKHENFAYVVIGTGIGGALVSNGQLLRGKHFLGGEFGFMIIKQDPESVWSFEGGFYALLAKAKKMGYEVENGVALFELSKTEPEIMQLIQDFYKTTAIGLFNIQYMFDPEIIFIAGAISQRNDLIDHLNQAVNELIKHPMITVKPHIEVSSLKHYANLYGALANYLIEYEGFKKST